MLIVKNDGILSNYDKYKAKTRFKTIFLALPRTNDRYMGTPVYLHQYHQFDLDFHEQEHHRRKLGAPQSLVARTPLTHL